MISFIPNIVPATFKILELLRTLCTPNGGVLVSPSVTFIHAAMANGQVAKVCIKLFSDSLLGMHTRTREWPMQTMEEMGTLKSINFRNYGLRTNCSSSDFRKGCSSGKEKAKLTIFFLHFSFIVILHARA